MKTKHFATALLVGFALAAGACATGGGRAGKVRDLQQAAERGDPTAQTALGKAYTTGEGVPKDPTQAAHWLRLAAEQGDGEAELLFGLLHRDGQGVPQDYQEARRWILKSAEAGTGEAQYLLGLMYEEGDGVPKDLVRAHMWYNLASAKLTGEDRETAARRRDWVSAVITPAEVAQAQKLAREWSAARPARAK